MTYTTPRVTLLEFTSFSINLNMRIDVHNDELTDVVKRYIANLNSLIDDFEELRVDSQKHLELRSEYDVTQSQTINRISTEESPF